MFELFGGCYEKCEDAYDLGWKHGTEDIDSGWNYHRQITQLGCELTMREHSEYRNGYKDAKRRWD